MKRSSVCVVIVNWNAGAALVGCLQSFSAIKDDAIDVEIILVDNASSDGSLDAVSSLATEPPVRIVRNTVNLGFAAACNQGAADATAEFLLFLNPDTRLSAKSLEIPAAFLREPSNRLVGIAGVQLIDAFGSVTRSCARPPSALAMLGQSLGLDRLWPRIFPPHFMLEWDHGTTEDVGQVMGAFLFVRRAVFEELGGFDERFFVYSEDLDLALRARERGWRSCYIATARIFHQGGGSAASPSQRLFYNARSRILFALKHFNCFAAIAIATATLIAEPVARVTAAAAGRRPGLIGETLRGWSMLWADLPNIVRHSSPSTRDHASNAAHPAEIS